MSPKTRTFWPLVFVLVLADCGTKELAVEQLSPHIPHAILDSFLRFTLVCVGAIGIILDRFRYQRGVVDFIDVGIGAHRFWVFNIADTSISLGAIAFGLIVLRQDARMRDARPTDQGGL